jgi:hypothetical protein
MDIIERLFHVSPDHGSGTLELLYLIAIAFGVAVFARCAIARLRCIYGTAKRRM